MSDKDLQRVTESVSYIGQTSARRTLPSRRRHITHKVRIAVERALSLSMHDDGQPEVFLRVKGPDCSSELIGLYPEIARQMSLALLYGAPLEKVVDLLTGAKIASYGPVVGHARIKHCSSLPDLTSRHLLVKVMRTPTVDHVPVTVMNSSS